MALDSNGNYYAAVPQTGTTFPPSSGGGGTSNANEPVEYVADPNLEGLVPDDVSKTAIAYSKDGSGPFYGWDTDSKRWV